jgi:hypothetical protein
VGCRLRNFAAVATGLLGADVAFDIARQHYHVWSNGIMIRALATGVLAVLCEAVCVPIIHPCWSEV